MAWKTVERAIILFGFLIAAATLYYTAASYYRDDHGPSGGPIMSVPWWILAGGCLAVLLLVTGWMMMIFRSEKPKAIPTNLSLQFHPNNVIPTCLELNNIANWYSMRHEVNVTEAPSKTFRFWTLHVVFDRPVALKQIIFDAHGTQIPVVEVKDRSPRHAVIFISGDMPPVILDMKVVI